MMEEACRQEVTSYLNDAIKAVEAAAMVALGRGWMAKYERLQDLLCEIKRAM